MQTLSASTMRLTHANLMLLPRQWESQGYAVYHHQCIRTCTSPARSMVRSAQWMQQPDAATGPSRRSQYRTDGCWGICTYTCVLSASMMGIRRGIPLQIQSGMPHPGGLQICERPRSAQSGSSSCFWVQQESLPWGVSPLQQLCTDLLAVRP